MSWDTLVSDKPAKTMHEKAFTIGRLAAAAGVNLQTVRYYQRRGLLPVPPRPASGYRRYTPADVRRIRFIKRAQTLGFTLRGVDELLTLSDQSCRDVQVVAEARRADVAARLRDLRRMLKALDVALAACRKSGHDAECPLIDTLADSEEKVLDSVP